MPARPPGSPDVRKPRRADLRAGTDAGSGYTTREVAEALGLPTSRILGWAHRGLIEPRRVPGGSFVFSFQDIALLRAARELTEASVPARRVLSSIHALREQLPVGRPLSAVTISSLGGRVLVQDDQATWEPDSGQITMALQPEGRPDDVQSIARTPVIGTTSEASEASNTSTTLHITPHSSGGRTADDWYDLGVDLETVDTAGAQDAYRMALELDPSLSDAHLNLGRLLHEAGDLPGAREAYLSAISSDPTNGRAHFNLGVALEDDGTPDDAIEAYRAAVALEPRLAVAHFNLARLLEEFGEGAAAIQHLVQYRKLATAP